MQVIYMQQDNGDLEQVCMQDSMCKTPGGIQTDRQTQQQATQPPQQVKCIPSHLPPVPMPAHILSVGWFNATQR